MKPEQAAREWIVKDSECAAYASSDLAAFLAGAQWGIDQAAEILVHLQTTDLLKILDERTMLAEEALKQTCAETAQKKETT